MDEQLLQQLKESVDKLQPYLELKSINTSPVPYTIWTLAVSIFAALFGAIGAYYGWRAYHYSKRISNNVARMTADNQLELTKELVGVFYSSFVIFLSCQLRNIRQQKFTPAKSLLLRLRLPSHEDYFNLRDYNGNKKTYRLMVDLKQSMEKYNSEVDLATSAPELIMEVRRKLLYNPLRMIRIAAEIGNDVLIRMPYLYKRFKYNRQWEEGIKDKEFFKSIILQELFRLHVQHYCNASQNNIDNICSMLSIPSEWKESENDFYKVYLDIERLNVNSVTTETLCSKISSELIRKYRVSITSLAEKSNVTLFSDYLAKINNDEAFIDTDFLLTMICIDAAIEDVNLY